MFGNSVRFMILFFVPSFGTFEWQILLAKECGGVVAGQNIALAASIGQLAVLVFILMSNKRFFPSDKTIALALVSSVVFSWVASRSEIQADWRMLCILLSLALVSAVSMLAISSEIVGANRLGIPLIRIRPFGSVGFLLAAITSHFTEGSALVVAIPASIILIITHQSSASKGKASFAAYNKLNFSFPRIILIGFILGVVSKGYDVAGALTLRQDNSYGLLWLAAMIASEMIIVANLNRIPPVMALLAAPMCWLAAYTCLAYQHSHVYVALTMAFVSFNCTWQTILQSAHSTNNQNHGRYFQSLLAGTITIGGLIFTLGIQQLCLESLQQVVFVSKATSIVGCILVALLVFMPPSARRIKVYSSSDSL